MSRLLLSSACLEPHPVQLSWEHRTVFEEPKQQRIGSRENRKAVDLVGGFNHLVTTLKNMSQLGWWHSIPNWMESHKSHVPNHEAVTAFKASFPADVPTDPCWNQPACNHLAVKSSGSTFHLLTYSICSKHTYTITHRIHVWYIYIC